MTSIDLGLSVNWGDTNLGAEKSIDYGIFLSWSSNSEDDAKGMPSDKHPDECISGNPKYDPCTKQLENGWRLPTKEEFEELLNDCETKNTVIDGVNGILFIGKNHNEIFLPAAGCKSTPIIEGNSWYAKNEQLYYWSANFGNDAENHKDNCIAAFALETKGDNMQCFLTLSTYNWTVRYTIRPVKDKTN